MTREEAKKLVMINTYAFPNYKPLDLSTMVDVWATMLTDYDYKECELALKSFITTDTTGFAPSIGQLINKLDTIKSAGTELNEMEAWELVSNAIRNGTYHAEEEFNKLPQLVQKSVGTPNQLNHWAQSDLQTVESVIQSNFIKTYRTMQKRQSEYRRMPKEVRTLIEQNINNNLMIEGSNE